MLLMADKIIPKTHLVRCILFYFVNITLYFFPMKNLKENNSENFPLCMSQHDYVLSMVPTSEIILIALTNSVIALTSILKRNLFKFHYSISDLTGGAMNTKGFDVYCSDSSHWHTSLKKRWSSFFFFWHVSIFCTRNGMIFILNHLKLKLNN